MNFVVGFLFNRSYDRVALIRKNRPDWQAGKLNGVGGLIEKKENPATAMEREFAEETGATIANWNEFCEIDTSEHTIHFFAAIGELSELQSLTDEKVEVHPVQNIQSPHIDVISNLRWLIPMALDGMVIKAVVREENRGPHPRKG